MKNTFLVLMIIYFFQVSCAEQKQSDKGNYFTPGESFFDPTKKPYNYQLTIDAEGKTLGKIVFWRIAPLVDDTEKKEWIPKMSFNIYPLADSAMCINLSLATKANSACEGPNIGGDMYIIGNYILLNTTPCVECANKAKVGYCRNIMRHILADITDKNSSDLNYLFGQMEIESGSFNH